MRFLPHGLVTALVLSGCSLDFDKLVTAPPDGSTNDGGPMDATVVEGGTDAGAGDAAPDAPAPPPPCDDPASCPEGFFQLSLGAAHTCGLRGQGDVLCWGLNTDGQLGIGNEALSSARAPVLGVTNAVHIGAGDAHSCLVTGDGNILCWGDNDSGQLGRGASPGDTPSPAPVLSLPVMATVASGQEHTCGLSRDARVFCWGRNTDGQVGMDPAISEVPTPTEVVMPVPPTALAVGDDQGCIVGMDTTVFCWGDNGSGQLGNDVGLTSSVPVQVTMSTGAPLSGVVQVSLGDDHSCARLEDGRVWCWGGNLDGQLGNGTSGGSSVVPTPVMGLTDAIDVAAGENHTCALRGNDETVCWGLNRHGELGDGTYEARTMPTTVTGLGPTPLRAVFAGGGDSMVHTCGIDAARRAHCWGSRSHGQLGDGARLVEETPVATVLMMADRVETGEAHACSTASGDLYCWGDNAGGQLGDGTRVSRSTPGTPLLMGVQDVALGLAHSCAVTDGGELLCWGRNNHGQLGTGGAGSIQPLPSPVGTANDWIAVGAGANHTCGIRASGALYCWGDNGGAQLGDTTYDDRSLPTAVASVGATWVDVDGGYDFTCAVSQTDEVYCWGDSSQGMLGNGDYNTRTQPTPIVPSNGTAVATADDHACVIRVDGAVSCFGDNVFGQLGDGTTDDSADPVTAAGLVGVSAITAGTNFTCASVPSGVFCWGLNRTGQLGRGSTSTREGPGPVMGLGSPTAIGAGGQFGGAVDGSGQLWTWGLSAFGALGNGDPVQLTSATLASAMNP